MSLYNEFEGSRMYITMYIKQHASSVWAMRVFYFWDHPKNCENSNWGANRAKLIQDGSRVNPAVGLTTR